MDTSITITLDERIPAADRASLGYLAWLAACEAAPQWGDQPGTPALWCRVARVALDGAWPRDGVFLSAYETRLVLGAARDAAKYAGAPAEFDITQDGVSYTTLGGVGTVIAYSHGFFELKLMGPYASVTRRAAAAAALLKEWGHLADPDADDTGRVGDDSGSADRPAADEPELVRKYNAADDTDDESIGPTWQELFDTTPF